MRKKVDKTIKADWGLPSHRTVAQPCVAASSRLSSSFPPPVYDDTVALSREVASLCHPPAYDDTVVQSRAGSLRSRIPPGTERPFKKHKFREPQHTKTTAFAYQVAWNFQSSSQCSIFASTTPDVGLPGSPGGPPIHRPLFKGLYLEALGMAVSSATSTFSEPVNPHPYSLGFLSSSEKTGSAKESLLLANPVIPKGARKRLLLDWILMDCITVFYNANTYFIQNWIHPARILYSCILDTMGNPTLCTLPGGCNALTFKACLSGQMVLQLQ
jgi:hypothetical protein